MRPLLVVICGPTASGKTQLAIEVARYWNTEILSADSRQIYKELDIGVAKPSNEQLQLIKHHFINHISIHEAYSAGMYEWDALMILETLLKEKKVAMLCGGTGLYIQALLSGFDELPHSASLRDTLTQTFKAEGLAPLLNDLQEVDPETYERIDRNNPYRVIRALEIFRVSGIKASVLRRNHSKERFFDTLMIGLDPGKEKLIENITKRTKEMIVRGLREEAIRLYPYRHLQALQTVGYHECFDAIDGNIGWDSIENNIILSTRQYAKRQLTWFRKQEGTIWMAMPDVKRINDLISEKVD